MEHLGPHLLDAALTAAIGITMFLLAMFALERVAPFSIVRQVGVQKNPAVAVLVLSVLVGLGIILAATIQPWG